MRFQAHVGFIAAVTATAAADFLGPTYPAPTDLSSQDSHVYAAWKNTVSVLDAYLKHGKNTTATESLTGAEELTFSAGLFSLHDDAAAKLQYHHTAPEITSSPHGTNEVNGDSIYRVASVSKLITVFTGLFTLTEHQRSQPVTDFVPELVTSFNNHQSPNWTALTPSILASQLSGLPAFGVIGDLYFTLAPTASSSNTSVAAIAEAQGLPLPDSNPFELPPKFGNSTIKNFMALNGWPANVFLPNWTPDYSDLGFMVLGLIISRITGKPYNKMYEDLLFAPLGMTSSFANAPTSGPLFNRSVIAGPIAKNFEFDENIPTLPSGGILSSINDLNRLGIGILNGTLLSKEATRAWMKPRTHTASLSYSVGEPWEIVRYINKDTGKFTDIYTKYGDSGSYGGMLAIIPDYDAGFTFLNAQFNSTKRGEVALKTINLIGEALLPALEAQAAAEATNHYVGTYHSSDPKINSTPVVAFNRSTVRTSKSGLSIQNWISNGTDMLDVHFSGLRPRLLLSIPKESPSSRSVSFQCSMVPQWNTYEAAGLGPFSGFYDSNFGWLTYDGPRWIGGQVDTFTFALDEQGNATAVTNGATKLLMKRNLEASD